MATSKPQSVTALVTGAGSGIGRAAAQAFAQDGAAVVVADVQDAGGQETVRLIEAAGGRAKFIHTDVSNAGDVQTMVQFAVREFGGLDYAFNNAGIENVAKNLADTSEEVWSQVIAVNLTGVWLCMKYELQHMRTRKAGAIVNNSSIAGLVGFANSGAYVASKHGVIGLTKTAALEFAPLGIRVNAVCPGVIRTPMIERAAAENPQMLATVSAAHPMQRIGKPEEVAEVVLWLCKSSHFVTGQALAVDGGYVAQ